MRSLEWRTLYRAPALAALCLALSACSAHAAKTWSVGNPISGQIEAPTGSQQVYVGQSVAFTAHGFDPDHWVDDEEDEPEEGDECDALQTPVWSASNGTFPNGNTGWSVSWKAPSNEGNSTITCTLEDVGEVVSPDTGDRDDDPLEMNVYVHVALPQFDIKVRCPISGNPFADSTSVATGGLCPPEHHAEIEITAIPPTEGVTVPPLQIINGHGEGGRDATVAMEDTITGADGKIRGSFTSSDKSTDVTLRVGEGAQGPSATIHQRWNQDGSPWFCDPYFYFEEPSSITFHPQFWDGEMPVPITEHTMNFIVTSAEVWHWNPLLWDGEGDYEPLTYTSEPGDPNSGLLASLVTFDPPSVIDQPAPSWYTSQQTVHWSDYDIVDTVYFVAEDDAAYR